MAGIVNKGSFRIRIHIHALNSKNHFFNAKYSLQKILIAHVQYIKILTWAWGLLVIFLYSFWFSLCSSLSGNSETKNCKFSTTQLSSNSQKRLEHKKKQTKYRKMTRKPRSHVRIFMYWTWAVKINVSLQCTYLPRDQQGKCTHTNKIFTVFSRNVYPPTLISKGFNLSPQQSPLFTT